MNPILKRLDEIANNPRDPALGVTYSERAFQQRRDFCWNLRALLNALHAYHPHESGSSDSAPIAKGGKNE